MTDETEVLRIKREALEGLRDWTRSRVETVRDVTQYLREVLPPPAPRKVRAEVHIARLASIMERHLAGHIIRSGGAAREPDDSEDRQYNDLMQLIVEVEEGLGESADKDRPPDEGATFAPAPSPAPARCECGHSATAHGVALNLSCDCCECSEYEPRTPAPAPAPAPETREWWLVLSNHDLRPLCVYPTQERARRAALELHGSGCDAQSLPVVPRASLDATEAARRTDVATIQATADALYGDNNRPPAWQSGMPGAVGAMREERDQFQKAYDAAERHNTILRENVERHGDTIRTIRAQLREATERSELAREALREMGEFRDWYCAEMQTVEDAKAATGMSLWLSLRHALEERATLRAQLAAATGPVSRETMTEVAVAVARQMNDSHDPYDFKGIARAAITALGRSVEGEKP